MCTHSYSHIYTHTHETIPSFTWRDGDHREPLSFLPCKAPQLHTNSSWVQVAPSSLCTQHSKQKPPPLARASKGPSPSFYSAPLTSPTSPSSPATCHLLPSWVRPGLLHNGEVPTLPSITNLNPPVPSHLKAIFLWVKYCQLLNSSSWGSS